jgi:hypothetical protein
MPKRSRRSRKPKRKTKSVTPKSPLETIQHYFNNVTITYTLPSTLVCKINCSMEMDSSKFRLYEDELYIDNLSKCGHIKGKTILDGIMHIAQDLNLRRVELYDISSIERCDYDYSLAHFYILLTGESWYNKFGFVSTTHRENVEYNQEIRTLTLEEFLLRSNSDLDVDEFLFTFQVNPTDTVAHILRHIYDSIQTSNLCEDKMRLVSSLIHSAERLLVYNKDLVLEPIQSYPFTT